MGSHGPDPRLHPYRPDLAADHLRGRVQAARFVGGQRRQVVAATAPLRRAPRFDAPLDSEALHGETVTVFDEQEGWAWCQIDRDGYVGYAPAEALSARLEVATHRVRALRTFMYPAPDIKTPPLRLLSLNARLTSSGAEGRFLRLADGSFVCAVHAATLDEVECDFVAVAERFLGTPYLWGGRTSLGLDCSALVQLALEAAGIACPRDTDMQEAALGAPVTMAPSLEDLRRGDLVFWPGHTGIMVDGTHIVHANAHHMETTIEPLRDVAARNPDPIRTVKRL